MFLLLLAVVELNKTKNKNTGEQRKVTNYFSLYTYKNIEKKILIYT